MGYGCASVVAWGFIIPPQKLYPLLRTLRKLAGKPEGDPDSDAETTEEAQGPPAKKREPRKLDEDALDELFELMGAAMKKADDERAEKEIEPDLRKIVVIRGVNDSRAGDTVACSYSLGNQHAVEQWGHPEDYDLLSAGMGKTLSLEGNIKDVAEGVSDRLREALHFKDVGIKVEDQWILLQIPV